MTDARSCGSQDPQVMRRLFAVLVLLIGLLFMFGGYLLGRNECKRGNDNMLTYNLTIVADKLFKKAKRITPKLIHHNDSDKIQSKLSDVFKCDYCSCGVITKDNLSDFIRNAINYQVLKLLKTFNNASLYLDSLS